MSAPKLTLEAWLERQMRLHPRDIELGLDRVGAVWQRLGAMRPAPLVISVAGTNGKGSTVAFLEAMLRASGMRVGAYTSPHLLRYNERVRVEGVDAADAEMVEAFERIEAARGEIALTYFEFGTLAAFEVFARGGLDVAVLEVGLGGRLDAVNLVDADAAIVTTVDLDHQDWLGNERESIGREKAGIFRTGRPAVVGESAPPRSLLAEIERLGATRIARDQEFSAEIAADGWIWSAAGDSLHLPMPALAAPCQIANAAAAIAAVHALRDRIGWNPEAIARGVAMAAVPARLQRFQGQCEILVDVAHNPQAAAVLGAWLAANPVDGRTLAVFGALSDKDVDGIVNALATHVDGWHLAALDSLSQRGLAVEDLEARVGVRVRSKVVARHGTVEAALTAALASAVHGDRILAFGSFLVAAAAIEVLADSGNDASAAIARV